VPPGASPVRELHPDQQRPQAPPTHDDLGELPVAGPGPHNQFEPHPEAVDPGHRSPRRGSARARKQRHTDGQLVVRWQPPAQSLPVRVAAVRASARHAPHTAILTGSNPDRPRAGNGDVAAANTTRAWHVTPMAITTSQRRLRSRASQALPPRFPAPPAARGRRPRPEKERASRKLGSSARVWTTEVARPSRPLPAHRVHRKLTRLGASPTRSWNLFRSRSASGTATTTWGSR